MAVQCNYKFYSKFNLPKRKLRNFDIHNNVDSISYVDNSTMIKRSIDAGKLHELNYANAGLYDKIAVENGLGVPTQVYKMDIVDAMKLKEAVDKRIADITAGLSSGDNDNVVKVKPDNKPAEAGADGLKADGSATGSPVLSDKA